MTSAVSKKSALDMFNTLVGFRFIVRVYGRNVPGSESMVCACADLSAALHFARSFDKDYYDVDVFDADNSMAPVAF